MTSRGQRVIWPFDPERKTAMRLTLILTSALVGGVLLPAAAFSEPVRILECEVIPAQKGNWFVKADPTCDLAISYGAGGSLPVSLVVALEGDDPAEPEDPVDPPDEEDPEDPVDPVDPEDPVDPVDPEDPVDPPDEEDPVDPPADDPPADEGDH